MWRANKPSSSKENYGADPSMQFPGMASPNAQMRMDGNYPASSGMQQYTYVEDPMSKKNKQGQFGGGIFSFFSFGSSNKQTNDPKLQNAYMAATGGGMNLNPYGNAMPMNYGGDLEVQTNYGQRQIDNSSIKGRRRVGSPNNINSNNASNGIDQGFHAQQHGAFSGGDQNHHHHHHQSNGSKGSSFASFFPSFFGGGKAKGAANGHSSVQIQPMQMHAMGNNGSNQYPGGGMHPMNPMYQHAGGGGGYPSHYPTMAHHSTSPFQSKMRIAFLVFLVLITVIALGGSIRLLFSGSSSTGSDGGAATLSNNLAQSSDGNATFASAKGSLASNSSGINSSKSPIDPKKHPPSPSPFKTVVAGSENQDGVRVLYNTPLTEKFLNDLEAKVTKAVKEKQTNSAFGGKLTNGIEKAILMQLKSESTEEKQGFKEIFVVLRDGSGKNRVFNHKRAVVKVPTGWPDLSWEQWPISTIKVLRFVDEHGNDIQLVKADEIKQFEKGLKWLPWNTSPEIRKYADWSWTYSDGTEKDF